MKSKRQPKEKNLKTLSRDQFEELFQDWIGLFGLTPIEVVYDYIQNDEDEDERKGFPCIAVAYAYPYQRLVVRIYPIALEVDHIEDLYRTLYHEISHVILWKLRHYRKAPQWVYDDLEEETVERLALAFDALRNSLSNPS